MSALPRARGRDGLPRRVGRRRRRRVRRGGLHDRDDRLPGDRHRPELRRAARLLHGADGRQLRRRRRPRRVDAPAREGGADARGARAGVDGLARERGVVALDRHRHALARPPAARGRRDAGSRRRGRPTRGGGRARPRSGSGRRWRAPRSSPQVSTPEPYVYCDAGARPRRGRRLRLQALDPAPARRRRRARDRLPARPSTPTSSPRYDAVLLSNGPGDPEPLARRGGARSASCSAACRSSGSASATSCSASRPGHETYKLPFGHRGANHPGARPRERPRARDEPEPRLRGRADRTSAEATHVSLYDGTVEGFDFPELSARSVQFHPEAGPGPHDAWPILERWVDGGARMPRSDRHLARSA